MTIGGLGAVGAINRFDQKKADAKEGVDLKSSSASSVLSSVAPKKSSAPRSSNVSNENTKDFSRVLDETEKESSNRDANESLAGASAVAPQSAPADRTKTSPDRPTVTPGNTPVSKADAGTNTKPEVKATPATITSIEESISEIAASLEETADTELSMRHLSMRDLLAKMKDEFGVEPKSIVEAFANLDQAALMAPPDQTAEAVLSQLNLKPEQLPKAERFYQEMLNHTGESALNETLAGVGAGISLNVLSEQDVAMERLQQSIVNLNDSFARRDEAAAVATPVAMAEPQVDAPDTKPEDKSSESKFASIGAALTAAAASLSSSNSAGAGNQDSNSSQQDSQKPREFSSIESALASTGFSVPTNEVKATPLMAGTSTALASAIAGQGDATPTNAQDLVRHAQILVKQGGGEMKMQLKPEGVGEVTLKVAVKDGQVAIQMMTENDSAKKLLESNLDDLKTSLAQHKLHVDAVKIEVGGEMAKQRFEQSQQDASREQARQMAQDFMGQFRQDREGFRQGFSDSSAFKNYQNSRRNPLPEIEPVVASSVSAQKTSGERRLNLVA